MKIAGGNHHRLKRFQKRMDGSEVTKMDVDQAVIWINNSKPSIPATAWIRDGSNEDARLDYEKAHADCLALGLDMISIFQKPQKGEFPPNHIAVGADGIIRSFVSERDLDKYLSNRYGDSDL